MILLYVLKIIESKEICLFMPLFFFPFPDYELTYPSFVNHQGMFQSHDVHLSRRKRSTDKKQNSVLYLQITGFNNSFHFKLKRNADLLAPGFKIYHWKRNKAVTDDVGNRTKLHLNVPDCMYVGKDISKSGKKYLKNTAALTLCDGVVSRTHYFNFKIITFQIC